MATLFISDLHLDDARPEVTDLFGRFIDGEARGADALYILGDLFEAWVGDDDPSETGAFVATKLRALSEAGVPVFFMHGNRDFLVGPGYADRAGMTLLHDPSVVMLHGRPVLLMHGDTQCTDDVAYQQFRAQSRDPRWMAQFLSQPLAARQAFAGQARAASREHQAGLREAGAMEAITDVAPATVEETFRRFGIEGGQPIFIAIRLGGHQREKLVLVAEHPGRPLLGLRIELLHPVQRVAVGHFQHRKPGLVEVLRGHLGIEEIPVRLPHVFGKDPAGHRLLQRTGGGEDIHPRRAQVHRPCHRFRPWPCDGVQGDAREEILQHLVQLLRMPDAVLHQVQVIVRVDRRELRPQHEGIPVPDEDRFDLDVFLDVFYLLRLFHAAG